MNKKEIKTWEEEFDEYYSNLPQNYNDWNNYLSEVKFFIRDLLEEKVKGILRELPNPMIGMGTFGGREIDEIIIEELDFRVIEFRKEVKRLKDINSPIQILDTSKNFIIWLKKKYEKM